ncbi:MAG: hypothetical protein ACRDI2_14700, partial [Chloroflexota bacterium]
GRHARRAFFADLDGLLARYQALRDRLGRAYVAYRTGQTPAAALENELIYQIPQRQEVQRAVNALGTSIDDRVLRSLASDLSAVVGIGLQATQAQRDTLAAIGAGRAKNDDSSWQRVEAMGARTLARLETFLTTYARAKEGFLG